MVVVRLDLATATDDDTTTTRLEGFTHSSISVDDPPRREVRSLNIVDEPRGINIPLVINVGNTRINRLREVVRRHIGGHPDSNPRRSVDQEVREARWQDGRLDGRVVEVILEVYRILVDITEHFAGQAIQTRLRITHSSGRVAVN